jgi:glyoxylase-like metal-dependent hydrolase (beta-lactamase superfamily II)
MATVTLTRVTHSCVLLDFDGQVILTDPWFSEKPGYYHGEARAYASAADLPPLAGVVISHGHYDHCDLAAFAAYPDKTVPLVVNRGLGAVARRHGFTSITELDAWQNTQLGPIRSPPPRPSTRSPRSPSYSRTPGPGCSSVPTRCASPNSTRSPPGSASSTSPCCRSTGWPSDPYSTGKS